VSGNPPVSLEPSVKKLAFSLALVTLAACEPLPQDQMAPPHAREASTSAVELSPAKTNSIPAAAAKPIRKAAVSQTTRKAAAQASTATAAAPKVTKRERLDTTMRSKESTGGAAPAAAEIKLFD
jgi:hypothetical protein